MLFIAQNYLGCGIHTDHEITKTSELFEEVNRKKESLNMQLHGTAHIKIYFKIL